MKTRYRLLVDQGIPILAASARKGLLLVAFGVAGLMSAHSIYAEVKTIAIVGKVTFVGATQSRTIPKGTNTYFRVEIIINEQTNSTTGRSPA